MSVLIEAHYLGNVHYFSKFCGKWSVQIEVQENYRKGTYRNRCYIAGANGPLRLSIPLEKGKNERQAIRDVRISNATNWQAHHWQSIRSAYGRAPFFEFYQDTLAPFYSRPFSFLFDLDIALMETLLQLLGVQPAWQFTEAFDPNPIGILDLRNHIHPRAHRHQADAHYRVVPYAQVFEAKFGFLPDLSILDLLFCTGPEALSILQRSAIE